jgi:hypothetical protein
MPDKSIKMMKMLVMREGTNMSTRLYPNTQDKEILCRLAGAKVEDWEIMKKYREAQKPWLFPWSDLCSITVRNGEMEMPDGTFYPLQLNGDQPDPGYTLHCWFSDNYEGAYNLDTFLTFGWGRVTFPLHWEERMEEDDYYCGSVTDKEKMKDLLAVNNVWYQLNGVTLEELEGLYWS